MNPNLTKELNIFFSAMSALSAQQQQTEDSLIQPPSSLNIANPLSTNNSINSNTTNNSSQNTILANTTNTRLRFCSILINSASDPHNFLNGSGIPNMSIRIWIRNRVGDPKIQIFLEIIS